jgi:hypothetical protein
MRQFTPFDSARTKFNFFLPASTRASLTWRPNLFRVTFKTSFDCKHG